LLEFLAIIDFIPMRIVCDNHGHRLRGLILAFCVVSVEYFGAVAPESRQGLNLDRGLW
jgi:hypothetical protein